jgi:hypothetical protein
MVATAFYGLRGADPRCSAGLPSSTAPPCPRSWPAPPSPPWPAPAAGPLAWNAILRATHASQFFTDAPLRLLPASWQDTGSGVFALAATAVLLGVGPLAAAPARRTIGLAVLCGLAAFLVDVYLY